MKGGRNWNPRENGRRKWEGVGCVCEHVLMCVCVCASDREKHSPCTPFISSPCISAACFPPGDGARGESALFQSFHTIHVCALTWQNTHSGPSKWTTWRRRFRFASVCNFQASEMERGWIKVKIFLIPLASQLHGDDIYATQLLQTAAKIETKGNRFWETCKWRDEIWKKVRLGETPPFFLNAKVKAHASMRTLQLWM